jgi:transcriptional regulator GlxA family with amidase domain
MPIKFVFLILPQVHILDLAGADQALHEAMDCKADFEIEYCSNDEPLVSTSGLPFGKLKHYSKVKIKAGDFIIIPGSNFSYLTSKHFLKQRNLFDWLVRNYKNNVRLCSICVGAVVLAESGLLDGLTCTTHFEKTKALQELYPKVQVLENILFTEENGIYTSAGIASGIDLTLHIIEQLKGAYFAHLVARQLMVYNRRNGQSAQASELMQFRNHIHAGIHNVQDFLVKHIHAKHNLFSLAEIAHMSERNFTRIFKKETGITVNDFVTNIRRATAIDLMKNPDLALIEVAQMVGLQSEKQLRRILQKQTVAVD